MNEKLKQLDVSSTPDNKSSAQKSRGSIEDLRDPRFFMSKVDDESLGDTQGKNTPINFENRQELSDGKPAPFFSSSDERAKEPSRVPNIKVEN